MKIKKFLFGITLGYIFGMLLMYLLFDYYSWGFTLGSLTGVCLFGIFIMYLKKDK
ncbi:hypothetical protein ACIQZG_00530 [Lysinibacillus sp. NPDC096418]|uniref:hypothetical protein n=1 Tax=Lysinibacillus sp. NPDC096418 TaxID=3364138 RepID=UPI0037F1C222